MQHRINQQKSSANKIHLIFIILTLACAIITMCNVLATHTTTPSYFPYRSLTRYLDGYAYSAIAKNLAHGLGTLFSPQYGLCRFKEFYDHPALGLIIQSLFFQLFGDHWYSIHIMCAINYFITLLLIAILWKHQHQVFNPKLVWLPLLLWHIMPFNLIGYTANYLEPLAATFSFLAVVILIYSYRYKTILSFKTISALCLASLCLLIALLINGPLCLFVLCVDIVLYLSYKNNSFYFHLSRTLLLIMISGIMLGFIFYLIPEAQHNFIMYLNTQLIPALKSQRQDSFAFGWHHLNIMIVWLINAMPLLLITLFFSLTLARSTTSSLKSSDSVFFGILTLLSLMPISISSKQFFHYTIHSNIYFLLWMTHLLSQKLNNTINSININKPIYISALSSAWALLIGGVALFSHSIANPIPMNAPITSAQRIYQATGPVEKISLKAKQLNSNPYIIESIMMRNYNISWCPDSAHQYLIYIHRSDNLTVKGYQRLPITFDGMSLYKKVE